jgi:hypothetical protein
VAGKLFYTIVLLSIVLSVSLSGCTASVSAQDIVSRTLAAAQQVKTLSMDMHAVVSAALAGASSFSGSMTNDATAEVNVESKEMHMDSTWNAAVPLLGNISAATETFVQSGWVYIATDVLGWTKSAIDDKTLQDNDQLRPQIGLLKSAYAVTILGMENVDGEECYALQIMPDFNALMAWVLSQNLGSIPGLSTLDLNQLDLAKMFTTSASSSG